MTTRPLSELIGVSIAAQVHDHAISDVSGLQLALDGKQAAGSYSLTSHNHSGVYAPVSHSHVIADVTGLQTALDGKQAVGSYLTSITSGNVTTALGYTPTSVTGLTGTQSVAAFKSGLSLVKADVGLGNVDNTADASKTFTESQVTNLVSDLATKAPLASPVHTGTIYTAQPAPTAKAASATLTIAELLTGIVTATSASAVSLTLPTGTLTDAGILGGALAADRAFEWVIINLGSSSGATTVLAGTGHTIVGAALVPIGTSARFRTRKTATNTFITYRI